MSHVPSPESITFDDFLRVDIRVGRIVAARFNPTAIKPAFHLEVDFGPELGVKHSSAQLTVHYTEESLVGKPKRIAGVKSEVLVLGVPDPDGAVVLLHPDHDVPLGGRMF